MKTRIHRLCALMLISLLWLFAFAAQAAAQGRTFNPVSRSYKLRGKTGKDQKANAADGAASYLYGILSSFCAESKCADGWGPAGLIQDAAGNLYGTTGDGGTGTYGPPNPRGSSAGTVFKLAPPTQPGGEWIRTVLYSFCSESKCTDGLYPTGLIEDAKTGTLYGATSHGGANGGGMVFTMDTSGQETVLYSFCSAASCTDGAAPAGGLIEDAKTGNLYGVTSQGGANGGPVVGQGGGTVFMLAPPEVAGGSWTESVLYSFCAALNCTDGAYPSGALVEDAVGNLYGTTIEEGANSVPTSNYGAGTIFMLAPPEAAGGSWTQTVLYSFCSALNCEDGYSPAGGLIQDAEKNLYGVATEGGANSAAASGYGGGTVFELAPPKVQGGSWAQTVLYNFCTALDCTDGESPGGSLLQDAKTGNLYGTTFLGGASSTSDNDSGGGTLFLLAAPPQVGGAWTETVLYSFCSEGGSSCTDGAGPSAGLILDAAGDLYGTASYGGAYNGGTVFELAVPTFIVTAAAVSVSPGATGGNTSTITLTPNGGFTGSVTLTAAITSSPSGAQNLPTLSFGSTSPVSITGTSAVTATLTIATTAPTTGALAYPAHPEFRWYGGGATLAFGLFFGIGICIPGRRRSWRMRLGLLVLLVVLAAGLLSCSSSSGGGGGTGNPGTTPGTYTVTVTGTSGSTTATGTVTLTVQ
ncbi:MAG: choice-of-anchor tandem repeat GloVer-containing protein [Candidatus Sulfotelmatobacter sp.]